MIGGTSPTHVQHPRSDSDRHLPAAQQNCMHLARRTADRFARLASTRLVSLGSPRLVSSRLVSTRLISLGSSLLDPTRLGSSARLGSARPTRMRLLPRWRSHPCRPTAPCACARALVLSVRHRRHRHRHRHRRSSHMHGCLVCRSSVFSRCILPPRPTAASSRRLLAPASSRPLQPPPPASASSRRLQPLHPRGASSRRPRRLPSSRRLFAPPAPDALPQSPAAVSCSRLAPSLGAAVSTDGIVPLWQRGHVLRVGPCTDSCTGPLCMREGDRQNARARSPCVCRRGAACAHTLFSAHVYVARCDFPGFSFFSRNRISNPDYMYIIYITPTAHLPRRRTICAENGKS